MYYNKLLYMTVYGSKMDENVLFLNICWNDKIARNKYYGKFFIPFTNYHHIDNYCLSKLLIRAISLQSWNY
jgi:hypothetical protein